MGTWVELRVHGVSGTPPRAMLGTPLEPEPEHPPLRTGLRGRSAAYRLDDGAGGEKPGPQGQVLEAFHWGDHTSGARSQAYWLLLLPFGMANAAQFMLPTGPGLPAQFFRALAGGALRVLSLVLTVLFVLALSIGALDLAVWQWLGRAGWAPDGSVPVLLALGIVCCVAAVVLLSRLGRAGRSAAEVLTGRNEAGTERALEDPFVVPGRLDAAEPRGFSSPDFFHGDPDAPTLRRLHLTAGVLVVALLGWSAAAELAGDGALARDATWWTGVALGVVAVMTALLGDAPGAALRGPDVTRSAWGRLAAGLSWGALAAALVSVSVAAVELLRNGRPDVGVGGALPGVDGVVAVVAGVGLASLVALAVSVVLLGLATPEPPGVPAVFGRFAHGWAAALVAGLGLLLGAGLTASATLFAQGALSILSATDVSVTPLLQRVAFAWGVLTVVLVALAAAVWLWLRGRRTVYARIVERTFVAAGRPPVAEQTARRIGKAMAVARVKSLVQILMLAVAAAGAVLATGLVVEQWQGRCPDAVCPAGDVTGPLGHLSAVVEDEGLLVDVLSGLGVAVLVLLGAGLVRTAHAAFHGSEARRAVNVVWDVIAFWPRAAHPFVPEPYAQDVVPTLVRRITTLLEEAGDDGRVVVAAHSQGSLVALAALGSLPIALLERVGVLTFGSQLRLLFPRAFPAHVTYDVVGWLATQFADRWVSLYRETDHIGGPVAGWGRTEPGEPLESCRLGEDDAPAADLVDPTTLRRESGREWRLFDPPLDPSGNPPDPTARLRRHSDYWLDRDWARAVQVARTGLPQSDAPSGSGGADERTGGLSGR